MNLEESAMENRAKKMGSDTVDAVVGAQPAATALPISSCDAAATISGDAVKRIKLEMEEFGDLAPYLATQNVARDPTLSNVIDELNTPILDAKGPFDFTTTRSTSAISNTNPLQQQQQTYEDLFKFNFDLCNNNNNNSIEEATNILIDDKLDIFQLFENSMLDQTMDRPVKSPFITPPALQINNNHHKISNLNALQAVKKCSVSSVSSDDPSSYSNLSSPDVFNAEDTAPEFVKEIKPKLKLNIDATHGLHRVDIPNTPDVIDSVVSLENENFNIIEYIDERDITTVNLEDISFEFPSTILTPKIERHPSRKRRQAPDDDDDDDADYEPPAKSSPDAYDDDEDDSDASDDGQSTTPRRGRPPSKRASVSSSDDYSKYRELRDKNNEASRRSRLKRKVKEISLEKECQDLADRNVKLKAQVEELEKMVERFRSSLFNIILKK